MDKPDMILENTRKSLIDLREQLCRLAREDKEEVGELWSCKFNSGLFAVQWADTRRVLEEEVKSLGKIVRVVSPAKSWRSRSSPDQNTQKASELDSY
jgi:hypothetical protein